MKKIAVICICGLIIGALCAFSVAEEGTAPAAPVIGPQPEVLRIASSTLLSGQFFTDMWGNNSSDIDVRTLIHGYSTVAWVGAGNCVVDPTVVLESAVTDSGADRTYTFTLNEGMTYNDGTPITAKDYVFSVLFLSDPRATSLGTVPTTYEHLLGFGKYVKDVNGAMANNGGANARIPFQGVRLLDTYRFSLTISGEALPYFYELNLANAQPYPMHVIAPGCDIGDDGAGAYLSGPFTAQLIEQTVLNQNDGYLRHPRVTSGPYTLVSYDETTHIAVFDKNEAYLGNADGKTPVFPRLELSFANPETMLADLKAGKVDILHKIGTGNRIEQSMESVTGGELRMETYLRSGFGFLSFACEQEIVSSANVRRAVAMCIDAEALCMEALKGFGIPVYGYYGLGQWMANENQETLLSMARNAFSINAAREALALDGWNLNEAGEPYDVELGGIRHRKAEDGTIEPLVIRWALPENSEIAATLAEMLRENALEAGILIEETVLPFDAQLAQYYRQEERQFDMFFGASNFMLAFDPYYTFHTGDAYQGVFNTTGIADEELMELARDMRVTEPGDKDSYTDKWLAFQERWMDVLPAVPLYSNVYFDFYRNDLQGYAPNASWSWPAALLYAYVGEPQEEPAFGDSGDDIFTEESDEEFEIEMDDDEEMIIMG